MRQVIEDELRRQGIRLRELDVRLQLGLQESVRQRGRRRLRRDVHLAHRGRVRARRRAARRGAGRRHRRAREISLASATGRAPTRVADAFVAFARERLRVVIVRWGLDALGALLARARVDARAARHEPRGSLAERLSRSRSGSTASARTPRWRRSRRPRPLPRDADGLVGLGGGSAIDTAKAVSRARDGLSPVVAVPTTYAGAEWTPYFGMLLEARPQDAAGSGAQHRRRRLRPGAHARPAARRRPSGRR